jgi:radical SAM-linked protein
MSRDEQQFEDHDLQSELKQVTDALLSTVRYRIVFGKNGPLRYISHLDLARVWERVFRRAGFPLAYSQGYNPRPKIQLASGLPVGYASEHELLDVWVNYAPDESTNLISILQQSAPQGLMVKDLRIVDLKEAALQTRLLSASYKVETSPSLDRSTLERSVSQMIGSPSIIRVRRDKEYDLRKLVDSISISPEDPPTIEFTLSLDSVRGIGRADELLSELGIDPLGVTIIRTRILYRD